MALAGAVLIPLASRGAAGIGNEGKFLAGIELVWLIPVTAVLLESSAYYWPSEEKFAVPMSLLGLGAWCAWRRNAGKCCASMLPVLSMAVILLAVASVQEVQWNYVNQIQGLSAKLPLIGLMLMVIPGMWCKKYADQGNGWRLWLFATSSALLIQGIMGANRNDVASFYIAAQALKLGGLSRFEAIAGILMTGSYFSAASLLMSAAEKWSEQIGVSKNRGIFIVTAGSGILLLTGLPDPAKQAVEIITIVMWGILPVLFGRNWKKGEKGC